MKRGGEGHAGRQRGARKFNNNKRRSKEENELAASKKLFHSPERVKRGRKGIISLAGGR